MAQDSGGKWTEGPWRADEYGDIKGLDGTPICEGVDPRNRPVIAAAPEMAGLLRGMVQWHEDSAMCRKLREDARAILARIEGE